MITVSPGVRQFQTIHHWQHPYGPAHCLVRLHLPDGGPAVAHLGEFSSYDAIDAPEDFLHVVLDWDGGRYHGDMHGHHIMSERDIADLRNDVSLAPVPDVLRELGWTY